MKPEAYANVHLFLLGVLAGMVFWGLTRWYRNSEKGLDAGSQSRVYLLRVSQFVERFEAKFDRLTKALVPTDEEEYVVSVVLTGHCDTHLNEDVHDKSGFMSHASKQETFRVGAYRGFVDGTEHRTFKVEVIRSTDLLYVEVHGPGVILDVKINGVTAVSGGSTNAKRLGLLGWKADPGSGCVVTVQFVPPKRRLAD